MTRKTIGIGVIGAGAMGAYHVTALTRSVPGAEVVAVHDADPKRAHHVTALCGATIKESAEALLGDDRVEAVLVASPDPTHAGLVLACLAAEKWVLCEKPLATDPVDARRVIDAEIASGRKRVQLGFMRRYDPGFIELKRTVDSAAIGSPRVVHCVHRNPSPYPGITAAEIVRNSMIHELDALRWILGAEISSIDVQTGTSADPLGPQLASIRIGEILASIEVSVNARYGYDVRCEVLGDSGTATLITPAAVRTQIAGVQSVPIVPGFVARFEAAYLAQLRDWVRGVHNGTVSGSNAWDGLMAEVAAGSAVEALETGLRQEVCAPDRPALYA
jgi:myo-inositol 2-dehydrogenase/D-chiro-inositol 1-dehydrogenase